MKSFLISSGKMVISDPCYEIPTWCQGIIDNVKNGVWVGNVEMNDEAGLGNKVATLFALNEEELINDPNLYDKLLNNYGEELPFNFGVDSGQFGFFDFNHYRNDKSAETLKKYDFEEFNREEDGEEWYRAICELTLSDEQFGVLPFGIVSSSGYGDGSYITCGLKNEQGEYVALITTFINIDVPFCSH